MSSESFDEADAAPASGNHDDIDDAARGGASARSRGSSQSDSQYGSDSQVRGSPQSPDPEVERRQERSPQLSFPGGESPAEAYASDEEHFAGQSEGQYAEEEEDRGDENQMDEERDRRHLEDEDEPIEQNERGDRDEEGSVGNVDMGEPVVKEEEAEGREPEAVSAPSPADDAPLVGDNEWPPAGPPPGRPKRQRRRPQRWEGAPPAVPTRPSRRLSSGSGSGPGASASTAPAGGVLALLHPTSRRGSKGSFGSGGGGFDADDGTTASVQTDELPSPVPEAVDPLDSMHAAMDRARELAPRGHMLVVESFNEWQLKTISAESNHQKNLHSYLRRKLRKRASRMNERERKEEDALRNACSAPQAPTDEWSSPPDGAKSSVDARAGSKRVRMKQSLDAVRADTGEREELWERQYEEDTVVPSKVRLPLDSYIPYRVRKSDTCMSVDEFLEKLPAPPSAPGSFRTWKDPSRSPEKLAHDDAKNSDSKHEDGGN